MARVLLHSLVFAPDGVSTAYLMTDLALELRRHGHEVTVLTTTPHYNVNDAALAKQPITTVWPGLLRRSMLGDIRVLHVTLPMKGRRVIRRGFDYVRFHLVSLAVAVSELGRQDVVIAPSPPLTIGLVGAAIARLTGARAVYNVQELYPDFAINQGLVKNRMLVRALHALERAVYRANDRVVTISEPLARIIEARGVPATKLDVIPNFVDADLYHPLPRRNAFSAEQGVDDRFVVYYGGNLGLSQDWESLLFAARELADLPITWLISGGGAREEWLREQIRERGLADRVRLLGYLPRERMPEITAACDVATIPMLPTTTTDTFPSKIYTLMASARPVIVSADPGSELEAVVRDTGIGLVVPPGDRHAYRDAVRHAFEHRADLEAMGRHGREVVEREYSRDAVGRKYSALIGRMTA